MQNRKIVVTTVGKPDTSAMLLQQQRLVAHNEFPGFLAELLEARAPLVEDECVFEDGKVETGIAYPQRIIEVLVVAAAKLLIEFADRLIGISAQGNAAEVQPKGRDR